MCYTWFNIGVVDNDVVVSIVATLFMIKPGSVHQFMLHDICINATGIQRDRLCIANPTNITITSRFFQLNHLVFL